MDFKYTGPIQGADDSIRHAEGPTILHLTGYKFGLLSSKLLTIINLHQHKTSCLTHLQFDEPEWKASQPVNVTEQQLTPSFADVPLILQLIKAGAQDQAPGSTVPATKDQLIKTLNFEPALNESTPTPRVAYPLLMFSPDEKPAGLLIYFFNYSTWLAAPGVCLEELYVAPEYRGSGYARMLIEAMAAAAEAAGCAKMEWACLLDNERALKFYDKLGAKRMVDWTTLKVDQRGIEKLAAEGKKYDL